MFKVLEMVVFRNAVSDSIKKKKPLADDRT